MTRAAFALIALALGVGVAFLCLETAGIAALILIPLVLVLRDRASGLLPLTLVMIGSGFAATVTYLAIASGRVLVPQADVGVAAFFASQFVIGLGIVSAGLILSQRRPL